MTMKANTYRPLIFLATLLLAMLAAGVLSAQPEQTLQAYRAYQQQDYKRAADLIDEAITTEAGKKDAMTWHIRGFVYKDIFNNVDQKEHHAESRETAIEAFLKALEYDKTGEYRENNIKSLRYLGSSLYNDAVLIMRDLDKETISDSEKYYKRYKEVMTEVDQSFNTEERDVNYYKALATCYRKIYEENRTENKEYLEKALAIYDYVLELDPDNYGANYNTAINLYNEGAYGIEQIDAEAQIPTIVKVQAVSVERFREALPYMLKAHELDPTRRETLIGLRGIYLSLNNNEEANKYKDLLEKTQQADK